MKKETLEEQYQRYVKAYKQGKDIGIDKTFVQWLLENKHLEDDNFLNDCEI
jgi:hypothetical protein